MTPSIAALIERLEKAKGADRDLDCRIAAVTVGTTAHVKGVGKCSELHADIHAVARYTASIDAALQLVPETPHIASLKMERNTADFGNAWHVSYRHQYFGHHAVLPIAIVISALRTRATLKATT